MTVKLLHAMLVKQLLSECKLVDEEVLSGFVNYLCSKSCTLDPITSSMFKRCGHYLLPVITRILGFHSRDQKPCFSTKTKEDVSIIIAFNSRRIGSGHHHGRHFMVWEHQHAGRDVM